jgi:hypothetical protein
MRKRLKKGDLCKCRDDNMCFFVPGSIVEIVREPKDDVVTVRLLFGATKHPATMSGSLDANTMPDGSVQCYVTELERYDPAKEKINDLETQP